jgi:hypothetical protein
MKKTIISACMLVLITTISFAQHSPRVRFGSLDTSRVSVEEFNIQKELKIQEGYSIDSTIVLFGGANFTSLRPVHFLPEYDSIHFSELKALIVPGSVVYFQVFGKEKTTGKSFRKDFSYIFYGIKKVIPSQPSASNKELKRLIGLNYISGTLYFKGAHSDDLSIYPVSRQDKEGLKNLFSRLYPGASVIFDNVTYKDEQGNINKLNMTFKVE